MNFRERCDCRQVSCCHNLGTKSLGLNGIESKGIGFEQERQILIVHVAGWERDLRSDY